VQAYKPGSVTGLQATRQFVIYLGLPSRTGSIDLPTPRSRSARAGRAALHPGPIWSFNP